MGLLRRDGKAGRWPQAGRERDRWRVAVRAFGSTTQGWGPRLGDSLKNEMATGDRKKRGSANLRWIWLSVYGACDHVLGKGGSQRWPLFAALTTAGGGLRGLEPSAHRRCCWTQRNSLARMGGPGYCGLN